MNEHPDRIPVACPSCSPDAETVHEVLSTGGGRLTVRCTDCDHVHKVTPERDREVERSVVVSQDGESFSTTVMVPPEERVRVGEEFIVETEAAIMQVRITDLETDQETRVSTADAEAVETFWTRAVDNVSVNVTLHPREGDPDDTRSLTAYLPGDFEFTVGETVTLGEDEFEVTNVHVRETAIDRYPFEKLGDDGDTVLAKDIKRVYGYEAGTSRAWSAW
ncbi:MAG: HVO_0476 family zinc finger protein [Halodesulfurarchaeum sp.]|nr:HVO_0476 family zinc finger protein [Halodesulfurarchaeum sp.]